MKNMVKKSLSVVLATLMLLSTLTTGIMSAFADDIKFTDYTAAVTVNRAGTEYYRYTAKTTGYYAVDVTLDAIDSNKSSAYAELTVREQDSKNPDVLGSSLVNDESRYATLYSVSDSVLYSKRAYIPASSMVELEAGKTYQIIVKTGDNTRSTLNINPTDYLYDYSTYSSKLTYTKYETYEEKWNDQTGKYDEIKVIRNCDSPKTEERTATIGACIYGYDGCDTILNIPVVTGLGYPVKEVGLSTLPDTLRKRITFIAVSEGVEEISSMQRMYNLSTILLPSSLKTVSTGCFYGDHSLKGRFEIPENVEWIGSRAFYDTNLTSVFVKGKKTQIGSMALGYKEVLNSATADPNDTIEEAVAGFSVISPGGSFAEEYALNNGFISYNSSLCTAGNHPYTVTTKAATLFADGKKTYVCPVCGAKKTSAVAKAKLKIKSAKASKKAVTVKTSKYAEVKGYQIQVSTSKKFTKKTTKTVKVKTSKALSKKVTGLKSKKKYYVRVRAYKTSGKKTVYSKYSAVKSVKVK